MSEAAKRIGITPIGVYKRIKAGTLRAVSIGNTILVDSRDAVAAVK